MATYWADIQGPTAIYRAYDATDRLLYVGVTSNPVGRFSTHRHKKDWWRSQVVRIELEWLPSRTHAFAAEKVAIATENPIHNVSRPKVNV